MKNRNLILKYYKNNELYTTQILDVESQSAIAVGENSKVNSGFFGVNLSFDSNKETWGLWVNARKRVLSLNKKIKIDDKISLVIEEPVQHKIVPENIEKGTVTKIQIKVINAKGEYLESDILPNKRRQTYKFAKTKVKIQRPDGEKWESIHSTAKGYSILARMVEVPHDKSIKTPLLFNSNEKELIKKVAMGYAAAIVLTFGIFYAGKLIQSFFGKEKQFDVVKVDEQLLEQKREILFKEKPPVQAKPVEQKVTAKKVGTKRVKAFEKAKKVEAGKPKKAIAKKNNKPQRAGGKEGSKLAVQGVKSNKMKITQGAKPGAKGDHGHQDQTLSKLSKLSGLSGSIGFNAKSNTKASNLHGAGKGGDFAALRKGTRHGVDGGKGVGGKGGGTHGIGSYKVGGTGGLSLGGALRGGGTGASLSQGKTSRGFVDGLEEEIIVAGGLDRSVIERVIRRNLGDINYCYERRLNARPNLSGIFEAKFSIGANGKVMSVTSARNSLADNTLDSCIRGSIKTWQFPKPVGGTIVNVNYPFILKAT